MTPLQRSRTGRAELGGRGFTLVEIVVVLVLLGLIFGLVAPRFVTPAPAPEDPVDEVIDESRRAAVRGAGAVVLSVESDGRWSVHADGHTASAPLREGTLSTAPASALRLHISPLGACMLGSSEGVTPAYRVDPVACRLRRR